TPQSQGRDITVVSAGQGSLFLPRPLPLEMEQVPLV
ncbi:unnamed protein product, partial [marine sediment metagenome]